MGSGFNTSNNLVLLSVGDTASLFWGCSHHGVRTSWWVPSGSISSCQIGSFAILESSCIRAWHWHIYLEECQHWQWPRPRQERRSTSFWQNQNVTAVWCL